MLVAFFSSSSFFLSRAGKHLKMLLDSPVMSNLSSGIGGTLSWSVLAPTHTHEE